MGTYKLWAITRPLDGLPLTVYYGAYESIGDTAQVQLSADPEVDWRAIAYWDDARQEGIHCRCAAPAAVPVVLLTDYGWETPWKGVLCRTCLCLMQGIDPENEDEQARCWDAFRTSEAPPRIFPLDA